MYLRLWGIVQPYCDGSVSTEEFIDSLEVYLSSTGSAASCLQKAKKQ